MPGKRKGIAKTAHEIPIAQAGARQPPRPQRSAKMGRKYANAWILKFTASPRHRPASAGPERALDVATAAATRKTSKGSGRSQMLAGYIIKSPAIR